MAATLQDTKTSTVLTFYLQEYPINLSPENIAPVIQPIESRETILILFFTFFKAIM